MHSYRSENSSRPQQTALKNKPPSRNNTESKNDDGGIHNNNGKAVEEAEDEDDPQMEDPSEVSSAMGWFLGKISLLVGILCALAVGVGFPVYIYTLHDNRLWFGHIMVSGFVLYLQFLPQFL